MSTQSNSQGPKRIRFSSQLMMDRQAELQALRGYPEFWAKADSSASKVQRPTKATSGIREITRLAIMRSLALHKALSLYVCYFANSIKLA